MGSSLSGRGVVVAGALLVSALVACGQGATSATDLGRPSGESSSGSGAEPNASSGGGAASGGSGGGTSAGGGTSSGSTSASSSSGGTGTSSRPPPSQPPSPDGFQKTIAPLLDAQGCTECHHHGRPIDLTTYPFMTGTATATSQALVAAFTTNMPPAPRTAAPQSLIDAVNAWVAAGMKP